MPTEDEVLISEKNFRICVKSVFSAKSQVVMKIRAIKVCLQLVKFACIYLAKSKKKINKF